MPVPLTGKSLEDAIKRARTGQGGEYETGFSTRRMVDLETQHAVAEYRPFRYVKGIGARPVLFVVAEKEELFNNRDNAYAAAELLPGPKKVVSVPAYTTGDYIGEASRSARTPPPTGSASTSGEGRLPRQRLKVLTKPFVARNSLVTSASRRLRG